MRWEGRGGARDPGSLEMRCCRVFAYGFLFIFSHRRSKAGGTRMDNDDDDEEEEDEDARGGLGRPRRVLTLLSLISGLRARGDR